MRTPGSWASSSGRCAISSLMLDAQDAEEGRRRRHGGQVFQEEQHQAVRSGLVVWASEHRNLLDVALCACKLPSAYQAICDAFPLTYLFLCRAQTQVRQMWGTVLSPFVRLPQVEAGECEKADHLLIDAQVGQLGAGLLICPGDGQLGQLSALAEHSAHGRKVRQRRAAPMACAGRCAGAAVTGSCPAYLGVHLLRMP